MIWFKGIGRRWWCRGGVWQGSRLVAGGNWALLGCTVSPGFEYEDYQSAGREELTARWPEYATQIAALTHF
ncbi:MAG: cupin domain-containing protein [Edaphobacter sp.]|uniref:cupin domain-containing protein n=1 Tax=Edaphobacter sp. TaxID=1934404 RepID=UPI0023A11DDB|nr:cupin domain-containing protein [Edaphobacter sp.]MDE1175295.1 cupin domain-containing protein [Edaphobacter sp.]